MSAVQEVIRQRQRGIRRLIRGPWGDRPPRLTPRWPLLTMPASLIVYLLGIVASDVGLIGWALTHTQLRAGHLALFAALLAAAVVCIDAMRRLGLPSGVSRDLLSAWWLPIALLLPPLYALLAPFGIGPVLYLRARRIPMYRRVFSSAALGLAGAAASATFHLADPEAPLAKVLWDRESLLLDLTETCVGILVAVTCALSFLLLLIALPPVILLQRSLMHQQLATAARTDPKTGLLNASAWQREADAEVARARRTGAPLSLLLVDVDHFKQVNDSHGHLIGDEVLRALATELRHQVRESDLVGRFGGEEFTVLLPRTDGDGACRIAERLRTSAGLLSVVADPMTDVKISVTVSIGVAVLGQHGSDLFELLATADLALYQAKDDGRNQVRLYAPRQRSAPDEAPGERQDQALAKESGEATGACP